MNMHRVTLPGCNSRHTYLAVSAIECNGDYFRVNVHRPKLQNSQSWNIFLVKEDFLAVLREEMDNWRWGSIIEVYIIMNNNKGR